jgi:hypothetical protein
MSKKVISKNISDHLAVKAWIQLNPKHRIPERIDVIREVAEPKASVYRLFGIGHQGSSVIAKRSQTELAMLDRTFYEEILPNIPIPSAYYYGFYDEDDHITWLFLEDAGDIRYSYRVEEHRMLATKWMGIFHTSTELIPQSVHLPDRGFPYYLDHLRTARDTILNNLSNPALYSNDLIILRKIISDCDLVESKWSQMMSICNGIPRTLTHGDLKKSNACLRNNNGTSELIVFDWETAGIGIPTTDVAKAKVDINAYWVCIRDFFPNLEYQDVQKSAEIGKLLRCLAGINWEAQSLAYEWISESIKIMNLYHVRIANALRATKLLD